MIDRSPGVVSDARPDALVRRWELALDSLEHQVRLAEHLAADRSGASTTEQPVPDTWRPPELPGTMPAVLAGRAHALLDRQAVVCAELARSLEDARADLGRLGRARPRQPSYGAAYVDVSA